MNPSASGWINKFGSLVEKERDRYSSFDTLYRDLRSTGFVYGINMGIPQFIVAEHKLSEDECAKINLLNALYGTYTLETSKTDFKAFLEEIFRFYKELEIGHISLLSKILTGSQTAAQLEKLIDSRVSLGDNLISKTFNSIITNSLLFIDVLLFKRYLCNSINIREQAQLVEYLTINITYHALSSKEKNKSDERLAQLFASSLTFIEIDSQNFDGSYREKLLENRSEIENRYFLDVACLAVWEDKSLEYQESEFIFGLGKDLKLAEEDILNSLEEIKIFFIKNSKTIPFLKDTNLAIQFYDNMSKMVNKLILRNSKRLQKELSESKELVYLISKSTLKDLTPEEKKKVQNQLIDIFKSIPSLAIFILPGGAVLLPIFIKLIPKLLPSSFDENRVEK
ncbi:LETM1-related biofilm-associated protein [Zobellia sp. B3R18]|uniref:LETM1-related biofilm-associated protein n=1 Tax=Zobellia sp. B3R18 TaxID=2841568 RepID=UPI001C07018C|nr:LETM1-related biofilm-associated protein [Zobellia sp. B3R18]MBU2976404.1 LETM1 domain-containing protein [Zobellia sp. B3R18]